MSDNITVRGFVATEIKSSTTPGGVGTASFRLGSTDRHYDRALGAWVDGNTNWFTVQGYRQLAGNMGCSIKKGQRVIVVGRLKLRSWEKEGRVYYATEIDAESVGHDLMWGSANYIRTASKGPYLVSDQGAEAQSEGSFPAGSEDAAGESGSGEAGDDPAGDGSAAIYLEDANGELIPVDPETGELADATA
ncbi:single-stranded DNA-binding protein [Arthrobacter sp. CDRTa11]|uniref:single-stranded DNA-binding protein n=1 Tax=Arthrobacter sp. CDRTa11 TaxID=2651199 RepID=UPI002265940A|nr:single-stranded DNA-binding protein [Arthrobacter sp. CDRTa11]UZX03663.1 single-stranded DNA-binding protein [Arthrobacter sp. CDRTa11]